MPEQGNGRPGGRWPSTPDETRRLRRGMPEARRYTKCSQCKDLLWFDSWDPVPQAVQCSCGGTKLTETTIEGLSETPTRAEIAYMEGNGPPP